jgi:hypothetical protein
MQILFACISLIFRGNPAGGLEPLPSPGRLEVDAGEDHGQLGRVQLDAVALAGVGDLEGADFESLDVGITIPSFLVRYTIFARSGGRRHESSAPMAIGRDGSWG